MFQWNKNSIAYRLTFQVIIFSSMVAVLATALQLYLDYRQELRGIYSFFQSVHETSIRPLEESVWILDDLQVNLQLEGLIKRQDIVYAAVEMDDEISWSKGMLVHQASIGRSFPLSYSIRGRVEQIGTLYVQASLQGIYQRLLRRIIILLISNAIKTFLVSGFILWLFQKNVARHLVRLAEYVQVIDIRKSAPRVVLLDRSVSRIPDELDRVAVALEKLCQSGHQAIVDLRIQEQRLRLFFNATEEVIFGVDTEGLCTFINRSGLEYMMVKDQEELIGKDILAILEGESQILSLPCAVSVQVRASIEERKVLLTDEMPIMRPDGTTLLVTLRSYPVIEHGRCTGAVVFFVDISRQEKHEQEKQLFTKVIRQAPALILIADAEGTIEYTNARFSKIFGYLSSDLIGKSVYECFQNLDIAQQMEEVRPLIHSGKSWTGTLSGTNIFGQKVNLEVTIFAILDRTGKMTNVVAMGRDTTREQVLIEQLHHAQKMEAIGKLAASIAHEFGNPLLGIRFALRDMQQREYLAAGDKKLLELAENECDRMRKLIRDLQHFNRPSTGKRSRFDMHQVLKEILVLHQNFLTKKKIDIVMELENQSLLLMAVEDQIRQVFINLIINAGDAMAGRGGTLTLSSFIQDNMAVVQVKDDGPGISPQHLKHIFEPFFTTKSAVEGTGLGLPVSYGIVQAHSGRIEVSSEPGKTIFTVFLPLDGVEG